MSLMRHAAIAAVTVALCGPAPAVATEQVGEAVLIKTSVTGQSGPLVAKDPVHRDERIQTSNSGLGQFVFRDGTKLAVGWGSSVVIDKFVFDDSNSVKKLSIKAAKGTFRWISGNSNSSAYQILTPAGTIGVRGTVFDFYVGRDGTTAVVLLNGRAQFCGANGCRQLKQHCDCVVATPGGGVSDTRRVNRSIFATLGNQRALSFLTGTQRLSTGFGTMGTSCGLSMAAAGFSDPSRNPDSRAETPARPNNPDTPGKPDNPAKPDSPGKPNSPGKPSNPGTPNPPDRPNTPDRPSTPDKPGGPDKPGTPDTPNKPDKPDSPDTDRHHHDKGRGHHDHGHGRGNGHSEGDSDGDHGEHGHGPNRR
jgi:hypothetical protein